MVTLIAVYNSSGCVGRCDAKCYDAEGETCTCICGGANHGAGLKRAQQNTEALAADWIEKHQSQNGNAGLKYDVPQVQLPLF